MALCLGVNFEEGGNRSARRKPSKSGWDRLKLNPHSTFIVEVKGVIDVHNASLTAQGVQHMVFTLDGHPSRYQPRPTGLNFGEQTGTGVFPFGNSRTSHLVHHLIDVKKNFVNKLNLLKRSSFLNLNALLDLYFKIILPSVTYGLVVWGGCPDTGLLHCVETLHRRAARIIYNLPPDMPTDEIYRHWDELEHFSIINCD